MNRQIDAMLANVLHIITTPSWILILITAYVLLFSLVSAQKPVKRIVAVLCLWIFIIIAPVDQWLLQPLEQQFKKVDNLNGVSGIIVLGGGQQLGALQNQPFSGYGLHSARIIAALTLSKQHNLPLYFVGGKEIINNEVYRESQALARLHQELAIGTSLTIDNESGNTFDNALIARQRIPSQPDADYLLVTSAAHMPRAIAAFRKAGLSPTPYAVNYLAELSPQWFSGSSLTIKLYNIDYATHEWLGLLQYYALGRSSELFPKNSQ